MREDVAATSDVTTAFSGEATAAVEGASGCGGTSVAGGEATRRGETASSLGGLARPSASLHTKQKLRNRKGNSKQAGDKQRHTCHHHR